MNPKVEFYFSKAKKWQEEIRKLRSIVLECHLHEELKWGVPCYTFESSNIVLIHVFKDYCALLFFKGVLLKDPKKILIRQTENVQSARQVRFSNIQEIIKLEPALKAYILEAVEVEESGLKIELKKTKEYTIPEEFQQKLKENKELKKAFEVLTPGRQRAYLLYFSQAKQSKTRISRIEQFVQKILDGKGLND
ncbi:MAG: YdeI/OmpD-associated family protein [Bacteroidota bacterium]